MKPVDKIQTIIFGVSGYLILLLQQIPGVWVWIPLMAAPVILILSTLLSNLPKSIFDFYENFYSFEEAILGKFLILFSVLIIFFSIVYLGVQKRSGLVTTGPYRFVRHPQYTGFLLLTIGFTAWSYYYLTNFFGTGWLSPNDTILLWYFELGLYFLLAFIEDRYLLNKFGIEYSSYQAKTPSFIPYLKIGRLEYLVSLLIFGFLLFATIQFPLS